MREQVYRDPRPKEFFDPFHARARTHRPDWVYEAVRIVTTVAAYGLFRLRTIEADNVPTSGPVIIAPNHFSYMDHFFSAAGIRRKVRFMAKSQLFSGPARHVYAHGGVFPVRRGERDDEAFITARTILGNGQVIAMYPEGGRSRTGLLAERAKPGIGRLALESGAPVVPVAIAGSSRVRNWKKLRFPQVTVRYGLPIAFDRVEEPTREQAQAVADEIFAAIKTLHGELETRGRRAVAADVRARRRTARHDTTT